jgi:hypothetical protein
VRALPYVLFFGSFWAVPMAVYAAFADGLAPIIFPKSPTIAFLILAALGFGSFVSLCSVCSRVPNFPFTIVIPTAALVAVYTIANLSRDLSSSRSSGSWFE